MFCALSQNYQHLFQKINDIYILKQIVQGTQNDIEILVDQEGQSESTFPICAFSSRFFLFFPDFSLFS